MSDRFSEPPQPPALPGDTADRDPPESEPSAPGRRSGSLARPPQVRLGTFVEGGVAPAILAIVERGVHRRPALAAAMRGEIELKIEGPFPPVRIAFGDGLVLVEDRPAVEPDLRAEDRPAVEPDLRVEAGLADLVSLMAVPLLSGVPNVFKAPGRKAIGKVVYRQVRVQGRVALMRRLLAIIRI